MRILEVLVRGNNRELPWTAAIEGGVAYKGFTAHWLTKSFLLNSLLKKLAGFVFREGWHPSCIG
jgi:hypothetical protein